MSLRDRFFSFLVGQTGIEKFEQWIYSNVSEIYNDFGEDFAMLLVSFNFRMPGAFHDLSKIIFTRITKEEFERWHMIHLMDDILLKTDRAGEAMILAYELYCSGYSFLRELGITYGLCLVVPSFFQKNSWSDLSMIEKKKLTEMMYPHVLEEAKKIKNLILEESLILHGLRDDSSFHEYTIKDSK